MSKKKRKQPAKKQDVQEERVMNLPQITGKEQMEEVLTGNRRHNFELEAGI